MKNYITSRDYEQLWNQVRDGKEIVCFVTEKENRFTALAAWFKNSPELGGDGFFITAHKKIILLALNQERLHIECEKRNLEFIPPNIEDKEVLPCPFCGDKSPIVCYEGDIYSVWCPECSSTGAKDFDRNGAIRSWNTRIG